MAEDSTRDVAADGSAADDREDAERREDAVARPVAPGDNPNQERSPNDDDPPGAVGIPGDTGPNPPSMPGTSEAARPVQGVYRPDVGPGGADIDTGEHSMAGRGRQSRGPLTDRP